MRGGGAVSTPRSSCQKLQRRGSKEEDVRHHMHSLCARRLPTLAFVTGSTNRWAMRQKAVKIHGALITSWKH